MKRFLALVVVLSIFSMIFCLAEDGNARQLDPGLYVVGQDIEPGGYSVWVESDENVKSGDMVVKTSAVMRLYSSIDDYLKADESTYKGKLDISIHHGEKSHVSLTEGNALYVVALYNNPIFIKKDK